MSINFLRFLSQGLRMKINKIFANKSTLTKKDYFSVYNSLNILVFLSYNDIIFFLSYHNGMELLHGSYFTTLFSIYAISLLNKSDFSCSLFLSIGNHHSL